VKHHFRSLDTWLNGICKSCCADHAWQSDSLAYLEAAGKRSIFSDEHETASERRREEEEDDVRADGDVEGEEDHDQEIDENDECGGGDGEEEDEEEGEEGKDSFHSPQKKSNNSNNGLFSPKPSSTEPSLELAGRNKAYSVNDTDAVLPDPGLMKSPTKMEQSASALSLTNEEDQGSIDAFQSSKEKSPNSPAKAPSLSSSVAAAAATTSSTKSSTTRNRRVLSKSLDNQEQLLIAPTESVSSRRLVPQNSLASNMGLSTKEGNSNSTNSQKIKAGAAAAPPSKRVSRYSNPNFHNEAETAVANTSSQKGLQIQGSAQSFRSSKDKSASKEDFGPIAKTYYVSKSNGWKLVKTALDNRGWQQLPFEYQFCSRYGLKWVERRSQIDYRAHQPGQLVCHIANNDIVTTKIGLLTCLRDKFCSKSLPATQRKLTPPWVPVTFEIEAPADMTTLFEYFDNEPNANEMIWIYKPSCYNRGRGIRVISGRETLQQICYGNKEENVEPLKGIVQKYIENPLLVQPHGFKFDIRCYLLIARNFPTTFAFYHPGYCRLALKAYNKTDLNDTYMHLTNASVQKKGEEYEMNKDKQVNSLYSKEISVFSFNNNFALGE
jgi:hypothetical protein